MSMADQTDKATKCLFLGITIEDHLNELFGYAETIDKQPTKQDNPRAAYVNLLEEFTDIAERSVLECSMPITMLDNIKRLKLIGETGASNDATESLENVANVLIETAEKY